MTEQKAALAKVDGIPLDVLVEMGVSLVPLFDALFKAIAKGFERIGLRGKVLANTEAIEELMAHNLRQQHQIEDLQKQINELKG